MATVVALTIENIQNIHNIRYLQTSNLGVCIFLHSDKIYYARRMRIALRLSKTYGRVMFVSDGTEVQSGLQTSRPVHCSALVPQLGSS
jgi:hypothetical protein